MNPLLTLFATIIMTGYSAACVATSSLGDAIVLESNGAPCFTIEKNSKTKDGLPLNYLLVSELTARDGERFPDELWSFSTKSIKPISISPQDCIRYGDVPTSTEHRPSKQLIHYHVYAINIGARPPDTNILGYVSEFCIKPSIDKKITVQVIPRKKRDGKRQYDLCDEPISRHENSR